MKRAPHPAQPDRDNSGASRTFPPAVPMTSPAAFAVCEWQPQARHGNQTTAQHNKRAESAKRHYTAKRIVFPVAMSRQNHCNGTNKHQGMTRYEGKSSDLMGASFFGRKERVDLHLEGLGQNDQFRVRHAPELRFDFRERGAAQLPTLKRTARGEHFLRQLLLITQFSYLRADNVLRFGHAPKTELDTKPDGELNCTNFGATLNYKPRANCSL
jgi:hypothetical protein